MKYKDIKTELSKKYEISVSSIEKLIYGKGHRAKSKPLCPSGTPLKGRQANAQEKSNSDG